jgi:hypothetical protein
MTIDKLKELLNDPSLHDDEAERVRDEFRIFAEIIFEQWLESVHKEGAGDDNPP